MAIQAKSPGTEPGLFVDLVLSIRRIYEIAWCDMMYVMIGKNPAILFLTKEVKCFFVADRFFSLDASLMEKHCSSMKKMQFRAVIFIRLFLFRPAKR